MLKRVVVAVAVVIGILVVVHSGRAEEDLDSLIVCHETQKLIFQNAFVRVIDDVIAPGVAEPKHRHPHGVVIALEDADTEVHVYPAGTLARRHTVKGTATWNEAQVHDVKNVGGVATHFIRIDLK